jgi:transcriptional regulator of acetoin/glycerol metabolism
MMHYLYAYPWPGNVRELQNVVERATNLAINGVINMHQLPGEIVNRHTGTISIPTTSPQPADRSQRLLQRREREKHQILHLLNIHEGNVSQVARELGVSRKTIYNRMHRYAIAN